MGGSRLASSFSVIMRISSDVKAVKHLMITLYVLSNAIRLV